MEVLKIELDNFRNPNTFITCNHFFPNLEKCGRIYFDGDNKTVKVSNIKKATRTTTTSKETSNTEDIDKIEKIRKQKFTHLDGTIEENEWIERGKGIHRVNTFKESETTTESLTPKTGDDTKTKKQPKKQPKNIVISVETKILRAVKSRMKTALKRNVSTGEALEMLGCNIHEYTKYLETKFEDKMKWDNFGGKKGDSCSKWAIDHITPINFFDLDKVLDRYTCFHYTNTQPLWYYLNSSKCCSLKDILPTDPSIFY